MSGEACCTCAALFDSSASVAEKPPLISRRLSCCGRAICTRCTASNPRFLTYCPFCQISSAPTSLPQGLRDPPEYSPPTDPKPSRNTREKSSVDDAPPAYEANGHSIPNDKVPETPDDTIHHIRPDESLHSIALRYQVPIDVLRSVNSIFSDHLLAARKIVVIPGAYYQGPSLSPEPVNDPEDEEKKLKIRRFMVSCKESEYDIALLYLNGAQWDLAIAIDAYKDDEKWEEAHPVAGSSKGSSAKKARAKEEHGVKKRGLRRFVGS